MTRQYRPTAEKRVRMSESANNLINIAAQLKDVQSVAIGGHVHPDGDCVGAVTGLYRYIRKIKPEVAVDLYLKKIPDAYAFLGEGMPICDDIDEEAVPEYDLFFCLDCGDAGRLGFARPVLEHAGRTVSIDHHISNPEFADVNRVEADASSTCEMLFEEFDPALIDREIATALFIGISHDTGIFRYSSASPKTFRIAAALMETGIDASGLITETYSVKAVEQQRAMADALIRAKIYDDGRMIASTMSVVQREALQAKPEHMDGIVEQMRDTRGVECAAFLHETRSGRWKLSLRSHKNVDVQKIAAYFNGGGHVRAAGAMIETEDPEKILSEIADLVSRQLETGQS